MRGPLVSVIVPVYNGERFLAAALGSVVAQDYAPLEVIVVDDGSEDGSAAIARSFTGVGYLYQPNQGPSAARNAGIAAARGEFIAFLDADDVMMPNKLSVQVGYLLEHPEVGCVLCHQEMLLEPGTLPPPWLRRHPIFKGLDRVAPASASAVVRASALERCGGFDPAYRLAEGMEWLGRIRDAGVKIAVLSDILMYRRFHGSNLSRQQQAIRHGVLKGLKAKIDRKRAARTIDSSSE